MMGLRAAFLCLCIWGASALVFVRRSTTEGEVIGTSFHGTQRFVGIPFAAPPVEGLRFLAPADPPQRERPLLAVKLPPACIQSFGPAVLEHRQSEDCLYLNVWAAASAAPGAFLPVMVWIHGGGYQRGSSIQYNARKVLEEAGGNAIVVTLNYRLGVFGSFALPGTAPQNVNVGLMDQRRALQWIQDNIAHFGGDPSNVMLYGNSAGGGSIAFHMCMRNSWSLFHSAILESPGFWYYNTKEEQHAQSEAVAWKLGCTGPSTLACMQGLSHEEIQAVVLRGPQFTPMIGYVEVPDQPVRMFEDGAVSDIPIIIGLTWSEGDFFLMNQGVPNPLGDERYFVLLREYFRSEPMRSWISTTYEGVRSHFGNYYALSHAVGDHYIACGTMVAANVTLKKHSPTYMYRFTQSSPYAEYNHTHTSEIPYVWASKQKFTASDDVLVREVVRRWINMAASGSPNVGPFPSTIWPLYSPSAPSVWELSGASRGVLLPPYEQSICSEWNRFFFSALPGPGAMEGQ